VHAKNTLTRERISLLWKLENFLEGPMLVLSFVWLVLMILEFTSGLSSFLADVSFVIWGVFILDYFLKLWLAPRKLAYIRRNWVIGAALLIPALRVFRFARAIRILRVSGTVRGLRLARVLTSLNRGVTALGRSLGRRGFAYVLALTFLVLLAGAAGMYSFEKDVGHLKSFGTALWWTAMVLTTMGSDYFPVTPEGRLLCLGLAVYGFAVFGYVTATVASYFVDREAADHRSAVAGAAQIEELKGDIRTLREEIKQLGRRLG
jgi:voltage-gated potassium channel